MAEYGHHEDGRKVVIRNDYSFSDLQAYESYVSGAPIERCDLSEDMVIYTPSDHTCFIADTDDMDPYEWIRNVYGDEDKDPAHYYDCSEW